MNKKQLAELQSEDTWEPSEDAETPGKERKGRAVVSVSFTGDDFERVDEYAEQHGLTLSELIRRATLLFISDEASAAGSSVGQLNVGGPDQMTAYFQEIMPTTMGNSVDVRVQDLAHEVVTSES